LTWCIGVITWKTLETFCIVIGTTTVFTFETISATIGYFIDNLTSRTITAFCTAFCGCPASSALVARNFSVFVRGKRIFSAKFAFNGTNGIIEFTLEIKQETRAAITTTINNKKRKRKANTVVVNSVVLVRNTQTIFTANTTYWNTGQT
jgi:hypothetical protein